MKIKSGMLVTLGTIGLLMSSSAFAAGGIAGTNGVSAGTQAIGNGIEAGGVVGTDAGGVIGTEAGGIVGTEGVSAGRSLFDKLLAIVAGGR